MLVFQALQKEDTSELARMVLQDAGLGKFQIVEAGYLSLISEKHLSIEKVVA
jgi:hypothetical protein